MSLWKYGARPASLPAMHLSLPIPVAPLSATSGTVSSTATPRQLSRPRPAPLPASRQTYRRIAAHEPHSREQSRKCRPFFRAYRPVQPDCPIQHTRQEPAHSHHGIRCAGCYCVSQAPQRRPADHRDLKPAGRERCGFLQHPCRRDAGQQRRRRGAFKGRGGAEHRHRREDLRHVQPSGKAWPTPRMLL